MNRIGFYLDRAASFFSALTFSVANIRLFRIAVYALFLVKVICAWSSLPLLYAAVNDAYPPNFHQPLNWIAKLFFAPVLQGKMTVVYLVTLAIVAMGILFKNKWLAVAIFFISLNYSHLFSLTTNGGDMMLGFFIFALIFLSEKEGQSKNQQLVTNSVWLLLKIHLCCIYFINGYGKIIKPMWQNGDAIYATWNLSYFANPHLVPQWFLNPLVCLLTAWAVVLFEILFPFLIWYQSLRKYLIVMGVVFHLLIGLLLSLPDFALTMIVAYIPFLALGKFYSKGNTPKKLSAVL